MRYYYNLPLTLLLICFVSFFISSSFAGDCICKVRTGSTYTKCTSNIDQCAKWCATTHNPGRYGGFVEYSFSSGVCPKSLSLSHNQPVPPVTCGSSSAKYQSRVKDDGWLPETCNGSISGTIGQSKRVEAIRINKHGMQDSCSIKYRVNIKTNGWLSWVSNGQLAGATDEGKRMEAIQIKLENCPGFDVKYRAHVKDKGWLDWLSNGQLAGTTGEGRRIEAIQIKINRH